MNTRNKTIIWILIIVVIVLCGFYIWWNQRETAVTSEAAEMFNLEAPINIEEVALYSDGGTTGVYAKDNTGKMFLFCLDGRMQIEKPGKTLEPYHLYIGASHPEHDGAEQLSLNGEKEKAILEILQNWVSENISAEVKDKLSNTSTVIGLSEEEVKLYRILNLAERLEKRS